MLGYRLDEDVIILERNYWEGTRKVERSRSIP